MPQAFPLSLLLLYGVQSRELVLNKGPQQGFASFISCWNHPVSPAKVGLDQISVSLVAGDVPASVFTLLLKHIPTYLKFRFQAVRNTRA